MAGADFLSFGLVGGTRRSATGLAQRLYATPLYALTLVGSAPRRLARLPPPRAPGDAERGNAILAGRLVCAGHNFDSAAPDWFAAAAGGSALAELHAFDWLDDLAAVGTPDAHRLARDLIAYWLQAGSRWDASGWAPAVLARRLIGWLTHARFIASGDDDPLSAPLLQSAARQTRHLARTVSAAAPGLERLVAASGLIHAGLCGFGERAARRGTRILEREVALQVAADGSHVERSPEVHARAMATLVDAWAMLRAAAQPVPAWLPTTIAAMGPMLRLLRHGDGGLAHFNGTAPLSPAFLDNVLGRANDGAAAPANVPLGGFARMSAGQTVVLVDAGAPPPPPFDRNAHAGTLSFEMSCGRERMIVNCGTRRDGDWPRTARVTAAHSTAVIDDTNSSELLDDGAIGRRPGPVGASLDISDGNLWLTASHDGYASNFDIRHTRRLYLAANGRDLRGEDTLSGSHRGSFAVRFHLHPEIKVSLLHNAAAVLLRTPSGAAWRMQAANGDLSLAESIYLGAPGTPRRCEQIVISGRLEGDETVTKWAFRRIDPP